MRLRPRAAAGARARRAPAASHQSTPQPNTAGTSARSPAARSSPARSAMHAIDEPGDGDQHRAGEKRIGEERIIGAADVREIAKTSPAPSSTSEREGPREPRVLPHADPVDAGRLDRPHRRGVAIVERERNRDRRKDDRQRERTRADRSANPGSVRARVAANREQRRTTRHRERAPRGAVAVLAARAPPAARSRRSARRRRAGRRPDPWRRAVARRSVEDRDRHVEDEEQREERLHDRVVLGIVELAAPERAQHEREDEAHRR